MAASEISPLKTYKDYEVLGAGAMRRGQIMESALPRELLLHPHLVPSGQEEIYQAILQETLQWLRPEKISKEKFVGSAELFLRQALEVELREKFPETVKLLKGEVTSLLQKYLEEFPWQGPLLSAHLRYFPLFLKSASAQISSPGPKLHAMAQREWLWSYLSFADFSLPRKEAGQLTVNPSLQHLYLGLELEEYRLTPGLYIYFSEFPRGAVREYKLDVYEAAVLDQLQEERKFTMDQLLEQVLIMEGVPPLAPSEWQKKLVSLREQGIIL